MNATREAVRLLVMERERRIRRQYESGGWLVALQTLDIAMDGEPLRIPAGHKLTMEQALSYPGDTRPADDRRSLRIRNRLHRVKPC